MSALAIGITASVTVLELSQNLQLLLGTNCKCHAIFFIPNSQNIYSTHLHGIYTHTCTCYTPTLPGLHLNAPPSMNFAPPLKPQNHSHIILCDCPPKTFFVHFCPPLGIFLNEPLHTYLDTTPTCIV